MSRPEDAWAGAASGLDESACPRCGRENCEGDCPAGPFLAAESLADAATVAAEGRRIAATGIPYLVDGIIPRFGLVGLHIAYTGVGKSTLAQELGAAVASGRPFLGRATRRTRVLLLACEDPAEYVAWNARNLTVAAEDLTYFRAPLILNAQGLASIVNTVARDGYGLVLASSWQTLTCGLVQDENDNANAVGVMEAVKTAARQSRIPWLVDAHSGKGEDQSDGADPFRALRGASGAAGVADFALSLRYANGAFSRQRRLSGKGRFISFDPLLLEFDPSTSTYTLLDDPKTAAAESVWLQIEETGALDETPRTANELAVRAGIAVDGEVTTTHRRQVRNALRGRAEVALEQHQRRGQKTTFYRRLEAASA